jgi:hypothetical protein
MEQDRLPRQWLIFAPRNAGKSTFAAAMDPEHLVLDLDGRWKEQERHLGKSFRITESEPLKIVDEMKKQWPQIAPYVKTIVVDSGTAILDFLQSKGRLMEQQAREQKQKFNVNDLHKLKADTMRLLRFALVNTKRDYLWIFHTEESMESGKKQVRTTISNTELERMKANLNAVMTIVQDNKGMRGIRLEWSRYHNNAAAGQIIWDVDGFWKGVPHKLDGFLANYTGKEGYQGNGYSDEWLFSYLASKGITYKDIEEMYERLDIRELPMWFDRVGYGALIKKAVP